MKNQLATFLIALSLSSTALATKPYLPYTNTDMNTIGQGFEGVEEYMIYHEDGSGGQCTAVKVNIPAPGAVYLTAAHCLEGQVDFIYLRELVAHAFFIHPAYPVAQQFDVAALLVMGESNEGGYDIFVGDPSTLLDATTIHVGYGEQEGVRKSWRQGFLAHINHVTSSTYEQNLNQPAKVMAQITSGDSGGPLFVRTWDGNFQVAGVGRNCCDGDSPCPPMSLWALISPGFVPLVQSVFSQLPSPLGDSEVLNALAERQWLLDQGYQERDRERLMEELSFSIEALALVGLSSPRTEEGLRSLQQAADHGQHMAQFATAVEMFDRKNDTAAIHYLEMATRSGFSDAQRDLGELYIEGVLVERNSFLARYWIEAAAGQWNPEARLIETQEDFGQFSFCLPDRHRWWLKAPASSGGQKPAL